MTNRGHHLCQNTNVIYINNVIYVIILIYVNILRNLQTPRQLPIVQILFQHQPFGINNFTKPEFHNFRS